MSAQIFDYYAAENQLVSIHYRGKCGLLLISFKNSTPFIYECNDLDTRCALCIKHDVTVYRQEDFVWAYPVCKDCAQRIEWMFEYLNNPLPYLSHLNKHEYIVSYCRDIAHRYAIDHFIAAGLALKKLCKTNDIVKLIKHIILHIVPAD